jgi:hypothetical protein
MPIVGSTGSASLQSVGGFQALAFTAEVLVVGGGGRGGQGGVNNTEIGGGGGGAGGVQYRRNHKLQRNHSHTVLAGNGGGHTARYNGQKSSITGIVNGTLEAFGGGQGATSEFAYDGPADYVDTDTGLAQSGVGEGVAVSGASGGGGAARNNNWPNHTASDGGDGNNSSTPSLEPSQGLGKDGSRGMTGDAIPSQVDQNNPFASGGGGGGALEDGVTGQDALNRGYAGGKGFTSSISGTSVVYGNGGGPGIAAEYNILNTNWWDYAIVYGGTESVAGRGAFTYDLGGGSIQTSNGRDGEPGTGDGGGGGSRVYTNTNYIATPGRGGAGTVIVRIKNSRYSSQTSGTATTSDGYTTIVWALPSGSSSFQLSGTITTV